MKLFFDLKRKAKKNIFFCLWTAFLTLSFNISLIQPVWASDGATEALQLRYQAELAISQEQAAGHKKMAEAMRESLPGLLQEYLATRDGTIALDTVDAAFVQEQFKVARAMEEPGVALALDVFSGPGTGTENEIRSSISKLADFQPEALERRVERELLDPKVSERALDSYERVMERQMERLEHKAAQESVTAGRFDAKFEAKMEARLDATTARFEEHKEHANRLAEKAEKLAEKAEEKAQEKVEKVAEKVQEKAEKAAEKAVDRAALAAEKALKDAEAKAQADAAAAERAARGAELEKQRAEEKAAADAAAAERAARGAELEKQRAEEKAAADAAAAARKRRD